MLSKGNLEVQWVYAAICIFRGALAMHAASVYRSLLQYVHVRLHDKTSDVVKFSLYFAWFNMIHVGAHI